MSAQPLASSPSSAPVFEPAVFRLSPLITITLLSLYTALTIPLPFLSEVTKAPVPPAALWAAIVVGAVGLYGVLSERVILSEEGIEVTYPNWFPRFFRKGWFLPWTEVKALKPRISRSRRFSLLFFESFGRRLFATHAGGWFC